MRFCMWGVREGVPEEVSMGHWWGSSLESPVGLKPTLCTRLQTFLENTLPSLRKHCVFKGQHPFSGVLWSLLDCWRLFSSCYLAKIVLKQKCMPMNQNHSIAQNHQNAQNQNVQQIHSEMQIPSLPSRDTPTVICVFLILPEIFCTYAEMFLPKCSMSNILFWMLQFSFQKNIYKELPHSFLWLHSILYK